MKKFWKKTEGFTLVELVVVIAILGIMAGVGTVGYAGYVKKADQAADEQLLRNINQAFAAACIENGEDINDRASAYLGIDTTTKKVNIGSLNPAEYQEDFTKYFAGNENTAFRVNDVIAFSKSLHKFVFDAIIGTDKYHGHTLNLSYNDLKQFAESTYGEVGVEELLKQVNAVTGTAAFMLEDHEKLQKLLGSDAFYASAAAALGMDPNSDINAIKGEVTRTVLTLTAREAGVAEADIPTLVADIMAERVNPNDLPANFGDIQKQMEANAAVLFAAQETVKLGSDEALSFINSGNWKDQIKANVDTDPGKAMSQSALMLGIFTSYAYAQDDQDLKDMIDDGSLGDIIEEMKGQNFKDYMEKGSGKSDLEAYLASLRMIDSCTGSRDAVETLVANGFKDDKLEEALNDALNQL